MQDAGEVQDLRIEFQITRVADKSPKQECSGCMIEKILRRRVSRQLCREPRHFRIYQRESCGDIVPRFPIKPISAAVKVWTNLRRSIMGYGQCRSPLRTPK